MLTVYYCVGELVQNNWSIEKTHIAHFTCFQQHYILQIPERTIHTIWKINFGFCEFEESFRSAVHSCKKISVDSGVNSVHHVDHQNVWDDGKVVKHGKVFNSVSTWYPILLCS